MAGTSPLGLVLTVLLCAISLSPCHAVRIPTVDTSSRADVRANGDRPTKTVPKPVFLFHGVTGSPESMVNISQWLLAEDPDRLVHNIDAFNGAESWVTVLVQVPTIAETMRQTIAKNPAAYEDGYHLVCHSQGGIICRGIVEEMDDHNIDTFVSLAGPQGGQYGSTGHTLPAHYGNISTPLLYLAFYNAYGQKAISVANYWRDNKHLNMYYQNSQYLPRIDNMVNATARFKENWLRTKKVALCGGPDDGTIEPWISTQFGTYNGFNEEPFVNMTSQDFYIADTFGLRTMDERGDLISIAPRHVDHEDWVHNVTVFSNYIWPLIQN